MYRRFPRVASLENTDSVPSVEYLTSTGSCILSALFHFFGVQTFPYVQEHQYEHASQYATPAHLSLFIASDIHRFLLTQHTLGQPLSLPHAKPGNFKSLETNVFPPPLTTKFKPILTISLPAQTPSQSPTPTSSSNSVSSAPSSTFSNSTTSSSELKTTSRRKSTDTAPKPLHLILHMNRGEPTT